MKVRVRTKKIQQTTPILKHHTTLPHPTKNNKQTKQTNKTKKQNKKKQTKKKNNNKTYSFHVEFLASWRGKFRIYFGEHYRWQIVFRDQV
jgi:hypothetical protein